MGAAFAEVRAGFLALGGASVADFRAAFAENAGATGVAAAGRRAIPARLRTVHAQFGAFRIVAETHVGAFLAELRALDASVNTGRVFFLFHNFPFVSVLERTFSFRRKLPIGVESRSNGDLAGVEGSEEPQCATVWNK